MATKRTSSATLLVGDTGTGKSALIATYAEWVWKKFNKVTLLYSADGGGWPTKVEAMINRGIIWPFRLMSRGEAFETCSKASEGWWPEEWDPETGEVPSGVAMVRPVSSTYTLFCPNGHKVKETNSPKNLLTGIKCPETTCSVVVSAKNGQVRETAIATPGFEDVGARAYDGLTSMQVWILRNMAHRMAAGEIIGEKDSLGGKIQSGDRHYGGNNRAHYGFAQGQAYEWILNSTAVPGLVAPPVWTALEERGTDTQTKLPIYGPKIAGSAKTSEVPSWVGNCLGTTIVNTEDGKKFRIYLEEYRDEQSLDVPHLCKTRAAPKTMPEFLQDDDEPFQYFNLGYFFDLMEKSLQKTLEAVGNIGPGRPVGRLGKEAKPGNGAPKEEIPVVSDPKPTPKMATIQKKPPVTVTGKGPILKR